MQLTENYLPSNRNFGVTIGMIMLIMCLFFYSNILFALSLLILSLGIINSSLLKIPNLLWFKFGVILAKIINPIVLGLIYLLLFMPTAIALRLFKKDVLNLKVRNHENTYWVENKEYEIFDMKDQF
jgi:hypothetical protein